MRRSDAGLVERIPRVLIDDPTFSPTRVQKQKGRTPSIGAHFHCVSASPMRSDIFREIMRTRALSENMIAGVVAGV